ncbi:MULTISPECIES: hypothetical protein [unclassified Xanthomonas]|uniref:hypothetical protein n=1 Tax=unclassified Xanthomonas TaxID=2643310 RepID=UPI002A8248D9|nr:MULTISPECIES: hypothetical protein [unclassified Xanthomonas]MDY4297545.1 hypothetical protein [Xanthomonas sp. LF02-5]MDY4359339.1 hypothetical protein [Xanthomonas sp. LF04-12]
MSIGNDITVEVHSAYRGRAVLHVRAPSNLAIDRERNFAAPQNDDGPSAPTPEPSTK